MERIVSCSKRSLEVETKQKRISLSMDNRFWFHFDFFFYRIKVGLLVGKVEWGEKKCGGQFFPSDVPLRTSEFTKFQVRRRSSFLYFPMQSSMHSILYTVCLVLRFENISCKIHSPIVPVPSAIIDSAAIPITLTIAPMHVTVTHTIDTFHDSSEGIRIIFSFVPADVTFTFWRYSSTIASISVELSLSALLVSRLSSASGERALSPSLCGAAAAMATESDEVSCASSKMIVFRGDCGSPNRSHSRSSSSLCLFFLAREGTINFGVLKQRNMRRDTLPAVVAVVVASDTALCDGFTPDVFRRLYDNDESPRVEWKMI